MADITMCQQDDCLRRTLCYRYTARPSELWQSYFAVDPRNVDGSCPEFVKRRYPVAASPAPAKEQQP